MWILSTGMAFVNDNFLNIPETYLFSEIARKVNTYKEENPSANIIRLGIGDVTRPLAPAVIKALHDPAGTERQSGN